jgi:hypothetical protein
VALVVSSSSGDDQSLVVQVNDLAEDGSVLQSESFTFPWDTNPQTAVQQIKARFAERAVQGRARQALAEAFPPGSEIE